MEQESMKDYSYTIGRLPELKELKKAGEMMSDKGYEEAPLEDIPKRTDPWDDWKPNEDIE